jgi:HPt (histidine-containing phosphotransfer) domain-containing protein
MDARPQPDLAQALELLWQRFLPQMLERVAVLETAAAACASGKLSAALTRAAHHAAHKLAGSLGSFNLTRGSVLAHELEMLYSAADQPDAIQAPQLASLATELRSLIETR